MLYAGILRAQPVELEAVGSGVRFSYNDASAKSIAIAGEFNNWDKKKNPLSKDKDNIWTVTLPLKEGKTEYKFIINGEWMEGANLAVDLKRNSGTGALEIPKAKEKPGILSPYSQKIRFSGKYAGLLPFDLKAIADKEYNPVISTPANHVDLDWNVTPAEEAEIFFRTELDTTRQPLNLLFKQGYMSFHPSESYLMKMYYNVKFIQFDDPLKITDREAGLRYDGLYFVDELNPHNAYGLDSQGIFFQGAPLGIDFSLFYSNFKNYQQDDIGIRVVTKNMGPVKIGATYLGNRGVQWPYSGGAWLPDPQYTLARATYTVPNSNIQPWYKGFMYKTFTSFDLKYDILPETKDRRIFIFAEYGTASQELAATRWNEGGSKDSPLNKSWPISAKNVTVTGLRAAFSGFNFEVFVQSDKGKFSQSISTFVSFNNSCDFGSALSSVRIRYDKGGNSAGIAVSNLENKNFDSTIDIFLSPYSKTISFNGYNNYYSIIVKKGIEVAPYIKLSAGDDTNFRVLARQRNYDIFPVSPLYSGLNYLTMAVNHAAAPEKLGLSEGIIDLSQKIIGNWFFESSARYFSYDFSGLKKSGAYFTAYAAFSYRLKKNFMIRLGYGIDPEGFDEDVMEDFDRRELFLYNEYVNLYNAGNTADASLLGAEEALARHQRISLRTEIRF